LRDKHLKQLKE